MNHAVFFNGNVIIDSSYTLNVTCQVYCSPQARIIVRPGGKLIVDGGVITSSGNAMWQGVLVESKPDSARLERCQGTIILLNGAEISNALCGVNIQGGGIIKATFASFTNNLQGVAMQEYNHAQVVSSYLPLRKTYFRNCTFNVNSNAFFASSSSFTHVSLVGVQDAAFVSCSFMDTRNNPYQGLLGTGIYAFSSSIDTKDGSEYLFTPEKNIFIGLGTGISIQNSYENTSRILDCRFTGNATGIHAMNADYLVCRDNVFEITHPIYGIVGNTHGIILEASTQYTVFNNLFSGVGTYSIGISFTNSGPHNNLVKKNTFENLYVACYVTGCNGGYGNGNIFDVRGLAFECNEFLDQSLNDVYVSTGATIHPIQGAIWQAAGNYFTSNMNIVNNNPDPIQYYYDCNELGHSPLYSGHVLLRATQGNSCCDYGYTEGHSLVDNVSVVVLEQQYNAAINQYQLVADSYENNYGHQIPTVMVGNQASDLAELLTIQWQLTDICNSAIYSITADSVFDATLYETWLGRANTTGSYRALTESYFHHNFSAYNSFKNNELSRVLNTQDYMSLTRLYALRHAVGNGDLGWKNLDSLSVSTLKQIAMNGDYAGIIAKSVLTAYYGKTYQYDSLHPLFPVISFDNNRNGFIQKQFDEQHSKWFPEDAEWIYMRPSPSGPEVEAVSFYVKGDTVINEKKCVMTNIRTWFLGGKGLCFYEENDSVFYYNETTESFQILYDFSLQAGDSYVICPSDRFINDSLFVFIDSVTSVWVNGVSLRVQYVHTQSVSHAERPNFWQIGDINKAVIYETIGSLIFFIPQELGWNDDFFSHLCRYSGNGICFKGNPDEDCISNIGIPEVGNGSDIRMKVYPNPVSGMLHIQLPDAEKGIARITVCDLLGRVMLQRENLSKPELEVSSLPAGMYLLQVQTSDGKMMTAKFVKE
ncbi:MAG: T9SS type A sorting domain-containing protein [Bacteroidales bacterium]|nr:T9SS type A sorting domain-containing protein [Bacteroidales bacterium]